MKRLIKLFTAVLILSVLYSCSPDEIVIEEEQLDCECDRVVEVNTFTLAGTPENPGIVYFSYITTINDCTRIQRRKDSSTRNPDLIPQLGECR